MALGSYFQQLQQRKDQARAQKLKNTQEDKLAMQRGQYNQWLGTGGIGGIGPDPGAAPDFMKGVLQRPGMKLDPTQYRSVGGYTPQFAQTMQAMLYPGQDLFHGFPQNNLLGSPEEAMMRQQQEMVDKRRRLLNSLDNTPQYALNERSLLKAELRDFDRENNYQDEG
jgi:hypothetical protein